MGDAGEGRPEDLAGIVLEVGEDALVLALEAGPFRFAVVAVVALAEDAEVAHLDHIVDQFLAEFQVKGQSVVHPYTGLQTLLEYLLHCV